MISRPCDTPDVTLTDVLETTVARHAARVAVKSGRYTWTWEELNARANLVADELRHSRGDPAGPVALLMDADAPLLASLWGALKTGRFVVVLDPALPDERNRSIISDSGAQCVIVGAKHAEQAGRLNPSWERVQLPELETIGLSRAAFALKDARPSRRRSSADLACLIYTSGSTGRPKGVMNSHRMLLNYGAAVRDPLQVSADDRLTWLHSPSVAGAWRQLVASLLSGATLYPLPLAVEGLHGLARLLDRQQITILHSIASVIRNLDEMLPPDVRFPDVRAVVFGGERVWRRDVDAARRRAASSASVLLGLGCSEAGSICSHLLLPHQEITGEIAPIGRPIQDKQVQILDDDGRPVPPGEVGQIVVSSRSLSFGYWRQPELTDRVFRDDPDCPGARRYWTGDLGRMTADGMLWHAGRNDAQVKVRGFRVDLSEIEAALASHATVRDGLVQVFLDERGEESLAAYVTLRDGCPFDPNDLHRHLTHRLPAHMLPTCIRHLLTWPLTPGGKVDRKALPPPTGSGGPPANRQDRNRASEFAEAGSPQPSAPRDELESKLLELWRQIFGCSEIGRDDNFFTLGGHSLKGAQLFYRIQTEFGHAPPLSVLAEHPTVAQLARVLRQGDERQRAPFLADLKISGSRPPLFIVHGIGGEVLAYKRMVRHLADEWPLVGIQGSRFMQPGSSVPPLDELARLYVLAMQERQPVGPYHLLGYSAGGRIAYEMACQLVQSGETPALVVIIDSVTDLQFSWRQTSLSRFLTNAYWLMRDDLARTDIRQLLQRAVLKARGLTRAFHRRSSSASSPEARIERFFDVDNLPANWRQFMEQLNFACRAQRPRPGGGKVALIRCRGRGLFADHRPDLGWAGVAQGGVDIYAIRGSHDSILREPDVQSLCAALNLILSRLPAAAAEAAPAAYAAAQYA